MHAVAGDRVVCMLLSRRPDGSVAETTETFLTAEITDIDVDVEGDETTVEVHPPSGRRSVVVPAQVARVLRQRLS